MIHDRTPATLDGMTTTKDAMGTTASPLPLDRSATQRSGTAGLVAGPLFVGIIIVTTILEWDYLHDQWGWDAVNLRYEGAAYPSGLSTGPFGFLQIANFFVTGCLVLLLTAGLVPTLRAGASRIVTRVGLTVMGLALIASSAPTDFHYRPTTSVDPTTWHGWVHGVAFYLLMLGSLIASIAAARAMRRTPAWRSWALPTLVPAVAILVGFFLPAPWAIYVIILGIFGWVSLTGLRLRRLTA